MTQLPRVINKRCSKCGKIFCIDNEKGRITYHNIQFYPCTHCNHVDGIEFAMKFFARRKWLELRRCVHCFVPFTIKKHYAYGKCKACHEKKRRDMKKTNTTHKYQ